MPDSSLKRKTVTGFFWTFVELVGTKGVSFLFSVFLARMLSPDDYGLLAISFVFVSIAYIIADSGFGNAIIRKEGLTEDDLSTAFFSNIVIGVFCCIVLWLTAPIIAEYYKLPILKDVIRVSSVCVVISALGSIQQALFTREIDFKRQAKISFVSVCIGGIVGVTFAINGLGVWALVAQSMGRQVSNSFLLYKSCAWVPNLKWSPSSFKHLWKYGSRLMASTLLYSVFNNVYGLMIGKFYSAAVLGNFVNARRISEYPSSTLTETIQRVSFPVFSKLQTDKERLLDGYKKMLQCSTFLVFPIMTFVSASADNIVRLIYGEQWIDSVFILQVICFSMMLYPVHSINLNVLKVLGRSDLFFRLEVIKTIGGILIMFIAIPRGIEWIVGLEVLGACLALILNTYYSGKFLQFGFLKQVSFLTPIVALSFLMWMIVSFTNLFIENPVLQLFIGIVEFFFLYYIFSVVFLKDLVCDLKNIVKVRLRKA